MEVFSAHISQLHNSQVPPQLADHISLAVWGDILFRFRRSDDDATCYSCGIEWCCCLLTGAFCIFLCHPCIKSALHENTAGDQATVLNYTYFHRQPVVRFTKEGYLYINLSAVPDTQRYQPTGVQQQQPTVAATASVAPAYCEPVMVQASVVYEEPTAAKTSSYTASQPTSPASSAPAPRVMRVVLPSGGQAGQQVVVNTPDGQQVAITLSAPVAAGQAVDVQY